MSRDLSPSELDAWQASEAERTPSSTGDEDRETVSAMRLVWCFLVVASPALLSGVIALARHFLNF